MTRVTNTEERALSLLGAGVEPEQVASAIGVTPSYISQLLADETFAGRVATVRYQKLSKHNDRDDKYDRLEDKLLDKLERQLSLIFKPDQLVNALKFLNGAKRRGQSQASQITNQQTIVSLTLPTTILQQFQVNIHNQVVSTAEQSLETMQSSNLQRLVEEKEPVAIEGPTN